jgi:hypothetical protein
MKKQIKGIFTSLGRRATFSQFVNLRHPGLLQCTKEPAFTEKMCPSKDLYMPIYLYRLPIFEEKNTLIVIYA